MHISYSRFRRRTWVGKEFSSPGTVISSGASAESRNLLLALGFRFLPEEKQIPHFVRNDIPARLNSFWVGTRICNLQSAICNPLSRIILSAAILILFASIASAYPLTITDGRGGKVTIPREPKRIVSLTPNCTEILFALGLGDRVAGVTSMCDYPPAAKKKPKIGDYRTSIEKVVALKPDLIVAHANLNRQAISTLEKLGKTIIAFDPKTLAELRRDIVTIGRAANRLSEAEAVAGRISSALADVRKTTAKARSRPKVMVVIQAQPLWVAGPRTFVDEMIRAAHAKNIAWDARAGFNQFSTEVAVSRDPDVIIVRKGGAKEIIAGPLWKRTSAVRNHRVHEMDMDLLVRPGPRLAQGIKDLARVVQNP